MPGMSELFDKAVDKHMGGNKAPPEPKEPQDGKDPSFADLKSVASPEEAEMLDRLAEKCSAEHGDKGDDASGGSAPPFGKGA